jgi:hypothetical protein
MEVEGTRGPPQQAVAVFSTFPLDLHIAIWEIITKP